MRNPTYESELTKQGVRWSYLETITLDFVNTQRSLSNQARKDAAKEWGVKEKRVWNSCKVQELRAKLDEYKIKVGPSITDSVLLDSASVATLGDDVFVPFVRAVSEVGASDKEVETLVKQVRTGATRQQRLDAIQSFAESEAAQTRRAETKGGSIRRPQPLPRERLQTLIGQAVRLLEGFGDDKAFRPATKTEMARVRAEAYQLVQRLRLIFGLDTVGQEEGVA